MNYPELQKLTYSELQTLSEKVIHLLRVKKRNQKKAISHTEVKEADLIKINGHKEGCLYTVERTNKFRVVAREMNTGVVYNVPYSSVEIITQKQLQ